MWQKINNKAWIASYEGWSVSKNYMFTDAYGKPQFEYIATKDGKRFANCSWEYIKTRILKTTQTTLDL